MHETDRYITVRQAAKIAPGDRSANCVWRWCRKGVLARSGEQVYLQSVRVGGKLFTTARWLAEFGEKLAAADALYFKLSRDARRAESATSPRTDKQRQADIERAQRDLKEMGV